MLILKKSFDIPVIIIAQNWKDEIAIQPDWIVYNYDKLGITGARIKLREKFLESEFDQLIMMDDETIFNAVKPKLFLKTIAAHPLGWAKVSQNIQFAVVSRAIYEKLEFPDVDVNRDMIWEDMVFVALLEEFYYDAKYALSNCGIEYDLDVNATAADKGGSTWWDGKMETMNICRQNTINYIKKNIRGKGPKPRAYMGGGYYGL